MENMNENLALDDAKNQETDIKFIISKNITKYRKQLQLTQLELAEMLNYSDKTLSKWERGESIPDIITLKQLADIFNVTVDDLINDTSNDPIQIEQPKKGKKKISRKDITSITLISVIIAWLVAIVIFATLRMCNINHPGTILSLIYAIPISGIILVVFSGIWGNRYHQFFSTTFLIWGLAVAFNISFVIFGINDSFYFYIVAAPIQIMAFLFFILLKNKKKTEQSNNQK